MRVLSKIISDVSYFPKHNWLYLNCLYLYLLVFYWFSKISSFPRWLSYYVSLIIHSLSSHRPGAGALYHISYK